MAAVLAIVLRREHSSYATANNFQLIISNQIEHSIMNRTQPIEHSIINGTLNRTSKWNESPFNTYLAYWITMGLIGVIIVSGNSLVVWLVFSRTRLRVTGNIFIVSLSFADMGVGLTTIPASYICTLLKDCNFFIAEIFIDFFLCASIGSLITMTLDRYIAVVSPLRYTSFMTLRKVILIVSLGWLLPSVAQLVPSVIIHSMTQEARKKGEKVFRAFQIFVFGILSCVTMLLVYLRIFLIARKHYRKTRKVEKSLSFNSESTANLSMAKASQNASQERSFIHVLGTVIILYVICYLLTIYRGICVYFTICNVPIEIVLISRLLLLSNSAVNPVVYSLMKNDFRMELRRIIRKRSMRTARYSQPELQKMRTFAGN